MDEINISENKAKYIFYIRKKPQFNKEEIESMILSNNIKVKDVLIFYIADYFQNQINDAKKKEIKSLQNKSLK